MSCIHLTSQQLFSFGAMIVFLLCNRPAVYIYRFEMRRKIDEQDENRCFFSKKCIKGPRGHSCFSAVHLGIPDGAKLRILRGALGLATLLVWGLKGCEVRK